MNRWMKFILFTVVVGLVMGFFAVISDNLTGLRDGVSPLEFVIAYLAVMLNSLPVWFFLAMITGYTFARSVKESALLGAICIVCAIAFYFVLSQIYIEGPSSSLSEWLVIIAGWGGTSLVGGIIGGCVGFLLKRTPYVLLTVVAGLLFQLFLNGLRSWADIVGIAQNVTFCLMVLGIIVYLLLYKKTNAETASRVQQ